MYNFFVKLNLQVPFKKFKEQCLQQKIANIKN